MLVIGYLCPIGGGWDVCLFLVQASDSADGQCYTVRVQDGRMRISPQPTTVASWVAMGGQLLDPPIPIPSLDRLLEAVRVREGERPTR